MTHLEEKLIAKIKESMGDIIGPEDLKPIVARCIEEIFFMPVLLSEHYGTREYGRSLVAGAILELMEPSVKTETAAWFQAHGGELAGEIKSIISDGLLKMIVRHLEQLWGDAFLTFGEEIIQKIQSNMTRRQ